MQEVCKLLLGFLAEAGTENSKGHVNRNNLSIISSLKKEEKKESKHLAKRT